MLPLKAACLLSYVATFTLVSASQLAFFTPNFGAASKNAKGLPYLVEDHFVTVSWFTTFEHTTLAVFQELGNGTLLWELLAVAWPTSKTEAVWAVDSIGNHSTVGSKFYFFLRNSDDQYCDGCNSTSPHFAIKTKAAGTTSTTSQSPSKSPASASSQSSHRAPAKSPLPTASGDTAANSVRPKTASNLNIELGVGLGAGIPAVLAIIGILLLWTRHRRIERRKAAHQRMLSAEDLTRLSGQVSMRERDSHLSRESGALGPYARNASPTWEHQEAREQADLQQQQSGRHRRGSSARHIPFRPSLGAHSEVSDESSRHSWIDEFDFERPGHRDTDEMSQAERSIRAAPEGSRHHHTPSAYSQSSIVDVADIPPMPQPVHYQYDPDRNWPRR